jgi:20S proteasome subunit alpha 2
MFLILTAKSLIYLLISLVVILPLSQSRRNSNYDQNFNIFSPDGQLLQTSYANKAASKGSPLLCLIANTSIVTCTPAYDADLLIDRRISHKLSQIDNRIWIGYAGLRGDGIALTRMARSFAIDFRNKFGDNPTTAAVASFIGDVQHGTTLKGTERPFGVHVVVLGYDVASSSSLEPCIYYVKVTGETVKVKGIAIGSTCDDINASLEDEVSPQVTSSPSRAESLLSRLMKKHCSKMEMIGADIASFALDGSNIVSVSERLEKY